MSNKNIAKTSLAANDKLRPLTILFAFLTFIVAQAIWVLGKLENVNTGFYISFVIVDLLFLYNALYHYKNGFVFGGIFVSMLATIIATISALANHLNPTILFGLINVLLLFNLFPYIMVSIKMQYTVFKASKDVKKDSTIIVLGTLTKNGKPSKELKARLDEALKYRNDNPTYLLCGGGVSENISEAKVMENYLLEKGIPNDRIYVEDRSNNTIENLKNAKEIIKDNNLSTNLYVLSTSYHLYRVSKILKRLNIKANLISAFDPIFFFLQRWGREVINIYINYSNLRQYNV